MNVPFLKPRPPALSEAAESLREIEQSGLYSNFGPVNEAFERSLLDQVFAGQGACVTVANATLGLMLAIRAQLPPRVPPGALALMPAYTFAATAHAALWCGLTPLLCDVDADTWLPDRASEERLLAAHGERVATIVPYATFGADLDIDRYVELSRKYSVPVVVDAAASLGTIDRNGHGYGTGSPFPVVFSMQATKTFATGEAGVIYCADADLIERIRLMSNFGFGEPRHATMPGLNAKLSEVGALLAALKLRELDEIVERRVKSRDLYREQLPEFGFQTETAARQAHQFIPVLLPPLIAPQRDAILAGLAAAGIAAGKYFSPHLAGQRYFQETCEIGPLPVSDDLSARALSLPLSDKITPDEIYYVCATLRDLVR